MIDELTEPDEQISAEDMETLALDLLSTLPMEGVEGSPFDADVIWKTVERAATDATSIHHVVENTDETPDDDETVMDWLRTIDSDALETVVNDLLAEHATTILDPERSRIVIIDFIQQDRVRQIGDGLGVVCERVGHFQATGVRCGKSVDRTSL